MGEARRVPTELAERWSRRRGGPESGARRARSPTSPPSPRPRAHRRARALRDCFDGTTSRTTRCSTTTSLGHRRDPRGLRGAARPRAADRRSRRRARTPTSRGRFPSTAQKEFDAARARRLGFDPPPAGSTRRCTRSQRLAHRRAHHDPLRRGRLHGALRHHARGGHGLYEQGVSPELERTPAGRGVSLGVHESQSRLWENLVGRSRAFWTYCFPKLQQAFPDVLPTWTRTLLPRDQPREALVHPRRGGRGDLQPAHHPALRARAGDLIGGRLDVADLPEAWNARFEEYLGIPPDDAAACCRTCTGPAAASATSPPTPSATSSPPRSGRRPLSELGRPDRRSSRRGEFGELHDWLRDEPLRARAQVHAAGDAASASSAGRSTPRRTCAT